MTKRDAILRGVMPKRGMWIVCPSRERVYGPVVMVRNDGSVVWASKRQGVRVRTAAERLRRQTRSATMATHKSTTTGSPPTKVQLVKALLNAEREFCDAHCLWQRQRTEEARLARYVADLFLRSAECALGNWLKNIKGRGVRT